MSRRNRWMAAIFGIGLALAMTAQASAYGPQVPHTITVTPSTGTILCGHPTAIFATVLDQDGLPIKGVTVTWSFAVSPSSDDRFLQETSKTNKDGVARTNVKLACVAGDRTIRATVDGINGTAVVHVALSRLGMPGGGVLGTTGRPLPVTATVSAITPATAPTDIPVPLIPLAVVALGVAAFVLRRSLSHR